MDSRISLHKLEVLCLVVELGGVGRAAERLGVSQPVVTAHMRLLQDRLGVELLYRDGQQMRLTEAGEAVYAWAQEVLGRTRELSRAIDGFAGGTAGSVIVSAGMSVGSYLLPPVLGAFAERRPEARITLHVCDSLDAQRAAESGDCDLAVVAVGAGLIGDALSVHRLGRHELVLVAAPHEPRVGDRVTPAELATLPFVCSPRRRPRRRLVDEVLAQVGIPERRVVLELGHPEAIKSAVASAAGVALLMRAAVADECRTGALREVTIAGHDLEAEVRLIHRCDKRFTPIQRALMDSLLTTLGEDAGVAGAAATAV